MPSIEDALIATKVLTDLSNDEQEFLTRLESNPAAIPVDELVSHARLIKTLLGSQSALLSLVVHQTVEFDKKIDVILRHFEE